MSVYRVTLTGAEEQYEPATQEIDITMVDELVFIDVYKGSLNDLKEGREKEFSVPTLNFEDLMHALQAFNPNRMRER